MPTPIIFVDADGVLVNFDKVAIQTINEVYGTDHPLDHVPQSRGYKELLPDGEDPKKWFNALPEDWPRYLEALPGANEFMARLKELGARVVIMTKLTQSKVPYRIANLRDLGFEYDEFYAVGYDQNKSEYINLVLERFPEGTPWVFIDDDAKNIVDVVENGPMDQMPYRLVLFNAAHNELSQQETGDSYHSFDVLQDAYAHVIGIAEQDMAIQAEFEGLQIPEANVYANEVLTTTKEQLPILEAIAGAPDLTSEEKTHFVNAVREHNLTFEQYEAAKAKYIELRRQAEPEGKPVEQEA